MKLVCSIIPLILKICRNHMVFTAQSISYQISQKTAQLNFDFLLVFLQCSREYKLLPL